MRLKPYLKKNKVFFFYINDYDRNVSLGYGENIKVTKLTKAQKNLLNNFFETLNNTKPYIENFKKVSEHTEAQAKLYLDSESVSYTHLTLPTT